MATRKKSLLEQEIAEQDQNHEPAETNTGTLDRDISDTLTEPAAGSVQQELLAVPSGSFDESGYPDMGEDFAGHGTADGALASADESSMNLDELLCGMDQAQEDSPDGNTDTPRPKRTTRKKKAEPDADNMDTRPEAGDKNTELLSQPADYVAEESDPDMEPGTIYAPVSEQTSVLGPAPDSPVPVLRRSTRTRKAEAPVLTIEARGEVETAEEREDVIWHEIHNAYRTRRIITGQLGGIEQTDAGKTIAIVDYKGFRIIIPLKEMMINLGRMPSGQEYADLMLRQNKILGNMLGAEIDFIVMGIDSKSRSVVASRKAAMLKKRQIFYLDTDTAGMYRIYEGRIVQARIIAVAEKVIRVEVFGVECSIMARDLSWDWIGDAHERFNVGDQVLVRILGVRRDGLEEISIRADMKSVSQNPNQENLKKCRIQSKYAGKVTDVHKGVVYVRLSNGVNAVAHSCYDYRTPGKKDDVSFAVTRLDEERGVAVGIITRIIRQNL